MMKIKKTFCNGGDEVSIAWVFKQFTVEESVLTLKELVYWWYNFRNYVDAHSIV